MRCFENSIIHCFLDPDHFKKGTRLISTVWTICADTQRRGPYSTTGLKISSLTLSLTFFLSCPFFCSSVDPFFFNFFPPNSEQQLVSTPLKRALQCCQVIVLHTLAYSWGKTFLCSLVRCICAFYKLRGCLGQSAVCRGSLLWLMAWSFYKCFQPNEKEQKAFVCGGLNGQRQLNRKLHFWFTGCI